MMVVVKECRVELRESKGADKADRVYMTKEGAKSRKTRPMRTTLSEPLYLESCGRIKCVIAVCMCAWISNE